MNINELERLTGITKQNIRFYEKKELLHPARNSINNYREYTQDDLMRLKAIKLLRKLDLSLEDIHRILQEEAPLNETLAQHLKTLQKRQQELSACIDVCKDLLHKTKPDIAQTSASPDMIPLTARSDAAQTTVQSYAMQGDSTLPSQLSLLHVDETLRKIENMEKNGGKFMSIVEDYKRFAQAEHLKGFSFKPDTMVTTPTEFTEALQQYAEENDLNLVITKESMYPVFRIDGMEYEAERFFDRFGATIRCTLTHPEELETELTDISPTRRKVYKFLHGPWFFLLVLFLIMAISRQSFKWAFLVLAMIGPYLWWMFIRYRRW